MPRLTIIGRKDYGAPDPITVGHEVPHEQFRGLVLHHDAIPYNGATADPIAEAKRRAKRLVTVRPDLGPDWPYSWGLAPDDNDPEHVILVEGRGWRRTGAHTLGFNSTRYGVVIFGDYTGRTMTAGQILGFRFLGAWLADAGNAAGTLLHRDVRPTACPGNGPTPLKAWLQPPFGPTDIEAVIGPAPAPPAVVVPLYEPPLTLERVRYALESPDGGTWVLTEDGAVYGLAGARYYGGANGKPYFEGRRAFRLEYATDDRGRHRYVIVASSGERYGPNF